MKTSCAPAVRDIIMCSTHRGRKRNISRRKHLKGDSFWMLRSEKGNWGKILDHQRLLPWSRTPHFLKKQLVSFAIRSPSERTSSCQLLPPLADTFLPAWSYRSCPQPSWMVLFIVEDQVSERAGDWNCTSKKLPHWNSLLSSSRALHGPATTTTK